MTHIFPLCYATVNTYTWFLPSRWVTTSTRIPGHTQPWFLHQVLPSEITQCFYQMLLSHGISDISICCLQTIILMVSWENFNSQTFYPDLTPNKIWNLFTGSSWICKRTVMSIFLIRGSPKLHKHAEPQMTQILISEGRNSWLYPSIFPSQTKNALQDPLQLSIQGSLLSNRLEKKQGIYFSHAQNGLTQFLLADSRSTAGDSWGS